MRIRDRLFNGIEWMIVKGWEPVKLTELIGMIATVLAIVGVMLNNRMDSRCFIAWLFSNAICGWMHWHAKMYSLLVRDAVFFILAIYGLYAWSQKGM